MSINFVGRSQRAIDNATTIKDRDQLPPRRSYDRVFKCPYTFYGQQISMSSWGDYISPATCMHTLAFLRNWFVTGCVLGRWPCSSNREALCMAVEVRSPPPCVMQWRSQRGRGETRSKYFYRLWNYHKSKEFNRGWNTTHKDRWGVTACRSGWRQVVHPCTCCRRPVAVS